MKDRVTKLMLNKKTPFDSKNIADIGLKVVVDA
jgi:hypothetical protein